MTELEKADKINDIRAKLHFMTHAMSELMTKGCSDKIALGGYLILDDLEKDLEEVTK
jgi:hypothetical protein